MKPSPEPFVWWVKVREVAGAPTALALDRSGLWGRWITDVGIIWSALYDEDMYRWGYEKCFCSPLDEYAVNDRCPAHASVCI